MVPHQEQQHLQKQQISQKVQQPNIQYANRQQQIFAAGQDQSRMSQPSMLGLPQHQQLSGAGSDRLRIQRNPNALHSVRRNEFVSPQQTPQLSQFHQQPQFQNGMINQQKQFNQSERVLPKDSSALSGSTAPNQCAKLTDWHDLVYDKVQSMKNMHSLQLGNIFKMVCASCPQSPEAATKFRAVKILCHNASEDFRMSRDDFKNLSRDKVRAVIQRMKSIKDLVTNFMASRQHRQQQQEQQQQQQQQQQQHGSQSQLPEPEQKMIMKVPKSEEAASPQIPAQHIISNSQANKINAALAGSVAVPELSRHQMFQAQNINQKTPNGSSNVSRHQMDQQTRHQMFQAQNVKQQTPNGSSNVSSHQMDQQTRHQMFRAQNINQPIQQTLLDTKKQLMSAQKIYDVSGSKLGQVARSSPGILQQQNSVGKLRELPHLNANSPQTSRQASSQLHRENRTSHLSTVGTSLQNVASDTNGSSRSAPFSSSALSLNPVKPSIISPLPAAGSANHSQGPAKDAQILSQTTNKNQATSTGSSKILASPLMQEDFVTEENQKGISNESALQRFVDVVKSMSSEALCATVEDIGSIMNTVDTMGGASVDCESGDFTYYPENLLHGIPSSRRMKRHFGVVSAPAEVPDSEGIQGLSGETNNLESTAACRTKMPKFQHNSVLLDEINETNKRLVETALDVVLDSPQNASSADIGEGTVVRCTYTPVGNIELQKFSSRLFPLFSVQLLVPADYPKSSPVVLNDSFCGFSEAVEECDLAKKANTRFSSSLCELSRPLSLKEMARKWDDCARSVLTEFAVSVGGGSFSTNYGKWENCR